MKRSDRIYIASKLEPLRKHGELLNPHEGAVISYRPSGAYGWPESYWYIGCPHHFVKIDSQREIGRIVREGDLDYKWVPMSEPIYGKGWRDRLIAEFTRLTGLGSDHIP